MTFIVRSIQTVAPGMWHEKVELEKRFDAVEARLGGAAIRRSRCIAGADSAYKCVKEWEYDDLGGWMEWVDTFSPDPDHQALVAEDNEKGITIDQRNEIYMLLD